MKIKQLGHLALYTDRIEEMLDFYCNKLGLERVYSLDMNCPYEACLADSKNLELSEAERAVCREKAKLFEAQRERLWLTYIRINDGNFIELFRASRPLENGIVQHGTLRLGYHHMCIEVEDLEQTVEELKEKGVKFNTSISMGPDNSWQCWIEDPDGNQIELMEYTDRSMQLCGNPVYKGE